MLDVWRGSRSIRRPETYTLDDPCDTNEGMRFRNEIFTYFAMLLHTGTSNGATIYEMEKI
jgi:hypothetical protein